MKGIEEIRNDGNLDAKCDAIRNKIAGYIDIYVYVCVYEIGPIY